MKLALITLVNLVLGTYCLSMDISNWNGEDELLLSPIWKFSEGLSPEASLPDLIKGYDTLPDYDVSKLYHLNDKVEPDQGWLFIRLSGLPKIPGDRVTVDRFLSSIPFVMHVLNEDGVRVGADSLVRGTPGKTIEESVYTSFLGYIPIDSVLGPNVYLALKIAAHGDHARVGFITAPYFSKESVSKPKARNHRLENMFVIGLFGLSCIYSFMLFFQRREDRGSLWLGVFGLLVVIRYSSTEDILPYLIGDLPYWLTRIINAGKAVLHSYLMAAVLTYAYHALKGVPVILLRVIWSINVVCGIVAYWGFGYQAFVTASLLGMSTFGISLFYIARAVLRKEEEAKGIMIGFVCFFISGINDYSVWQGYYDAPFLAQYSILLFIVIESQMTGKRFAKAFRQVAINAKELESMNQQLKEQERARTLFFHNTSHELRTPLNGILGFLGLISEGQYGGIPDKVQTQVQKVYRLANSLMDQVNTILDLAKARQGELELNISEMKLSSLVRSTDTLAESLQSANTKVRYNVVINWEGEPVIKSDFQKIETILRNLVGNAFKFTQPRQANQVDISFSLDREFFTFEVKDQGIGIPKEDLQNIFEEFKQVDSDARRSFEGTGLGLSMVKNLVHSLNGQIKVDSELGKGSCFLVSLPMRFDESVAFENVSSETEKTGENTPVTSVESPIQEEMDSEIEPARKDQTPKGSASYKIFVVDDNENNCELMMDILKSDNYSCEFFLSGREALNAMKADKPDLILLDLMMPEVSGEDVIREMKADSDLIDIPVILVTARASQEDRLFGLGMGADDYLSKPIIRNELVLRVKNTLDRVQFSKHSMEKDLLEMTLAAAQTFQNTSYKPMKNSCFTIDNYFQSAEKSGGDWFGYFLSDDEKRIYMMIGDVTGHGMQSAVITVAAAGAVQSCISTIKKINQDIPRGEALDILAHAVNGAIFSAGSQVQRVMTMALLAVDLESGQASYLNAGHNAIVHVQGDGSHPVLQPGSPLGFYELPQFGIQDVNLKKHDVLFLYTDGLIENEGPDGKHLKSRALYRILNNQDTPQAMKESVLAKGREIWSDANPEDDCSFLIFQWHRKDASQVA